VDNTDALSKGTHLRIRAADLKYGGPRYTVRAQAVSCPEPAQRVAPREVERCSEGIVEPLEMDKTPEASDVPALAPSPSAADREFPAQFCPVCSKRLESWRCKMVCPRCGYFMSCSEFE